MPLPFDSVNSMRDLPPGVYSAKASKYVAPETSASVLLIAYTLSAIGEPTAFDVVVQEPDGSLRARDMVRLPDLAWRDSNGAKAEDVAALLPREMLSYRLVRHSDLDDCIVEGLE